MPLRHPAAVCKSANALSSTWIQTSNSPHIPQCLQCSPSQHRRDPRKRLARHYAAVHNGRDDKVERAQEPQWPDWDTLPHPPSPYQILSQKHGQPYSKDSKRRFYELVKLYHPDRRTPEVGGAGAPASAKHSRAVMLERYRMVINANSILSDPAKKEAYDRFGHGWTYQCTDAAGRTMYKYGTHHRWRTDGTAAYQWPVDQDPMYNATWEDWEKWYRQQMARSSSARPGRSWRSSFFTDASSRQSPLYASNYAFISIVFLLAALAGAGQATRANDQAKANLQRYQVVNEETSRMLMEARQNTRGNSESGETKDSRIRRFLRESEDYSEGEVDGRALKAGDEGLCSSGQIKEQNEPRYWQKPPENR